MRLTSEMGIDGVITVYAVNYDGLRVPVADFWLKPLMDGWMVEKEIAHDYQRQFAALLVEAHNNLFTAAPPLSELAE